MKGYQSFKLREPMEFDEFVRIVEERWNQEADGEYVIGRPNSVAIGKEEFVMLPATRRHIIIVRPRKKKMTLTTSVNEDGASKVFSDVERNVRRGKWVSLFDMFDGDSLDKERNGPAEEALQYYTARMKEMLADYML